MYTLWLFFRGETCSCVCVCLSPGIFLCFYACWSLFFSYVLSMYRLSHVTNFVPAKCTIPRFCMQFCVKIITPDLFVPHTPSSVLSLPFVSARLALCLCLGWMDSSSCSPVPRTLWGAAATTCRHWQAAEAMSVWRGWVPSALNLNTLLHRR